MSSNHKGNGRKTTIPTVWRNRKKPFLFIQILLALTATILAIINLIRWNTNLPFISSLIILLVGAVFVLRGIETHLNEGNGDKLTFSFGLLICIIATVTLVRDLWL